MPQPVVPRTEATPVVADMPAPVESPPLLAAPTVAPPSTPEPVSTPPTVPAIDRITASSELAPQRYRGEVRSYEPIRAFDGNEDTAWLPTGSGLQDWIKVSFKAPTLIRSISIFGGYGIDLARYQRNNRVRELRIHFSNGTSQTCALEDKMRPQRFELPSETVVAWLRFEILSVYRGTKYNSTPISEIAFSSD